MTRSIEQHASYKAFLDRLYREGDPKRVTFQVSKPARRRAIVRSRVARQAMAAAQRVLALMNK